MSSVGILTWELDPNHRLGGYLGSWAFIASFQLL